MVEIERRCGELLCGARMRLSLTKDDARAYTGFECERCGRWYADALTERDIPEWWEALNVASLRGLKPKRESLRPAREQSSTVQNSTPLLKEELKPADKLTRAVEDEDEDEENEAEVVARMSREWRRLGGEREAVPNDAEAKQGDSF